ncbi:MAG: aminoacyl-tRNA hydrolase [Saprospiraceae bacterium]|nr:aminoacyl-tRNA hydrolase [Saprospiraceae bacterium]
MKYLIAGLGNIGSEYEHTRHNIGFDVVEYLAAQNGGIWKHDTLAFVCEIKHKGRTLVLIKPTTYMNLSGKAVNHWMQKHKIPKENIMVVIDDLNLDLGTLRIREKGSDGGHNGLKNIDAVTGGNDYPRLRIGIGNKFHKNQQVDFVLGKWKPDEKERVKLITEKAAAACLSFAAIGIKHTMNGFNGNLE